MIRAGLHALRRLPKAVVPRRNYETVTTPPMVFVPFWEKVLHGCLLSTMIFGYPMWVLCHVPYYVKVGLGEIKVD
uniref:Cytochrome c oxidase polypeptide VIIc n=1 Tax=Trichuris muris TaxID=70415 RepID=A0A5S6R5W8_TRIMR